MPETTLSPRDRRRAKIARDAGLYVRDLVTVDGIEKPLVTEMDWLASTSTNTRFHVPCEKDDPGASLDLNAGERVLRGMSTVAGEQSRHRVAIARPL